MYKPQITNRSTFFFFFFLSVDFMYVSADLPMEVVDMNIIFACSSFVCHVMLS